MSDPFLSAYQRRIQLTESMAIGTDLSVGLLGKHVQQLEQTVTELAATVSVLRALLVERAAIDPVELAAKVEAAVDTIRAAGPQVRCVRCGATVPARRTDVTADGPVCDRCA
jgi:hypothetical protein